MTQPKKQKPQTKPTLKPNAKIIPSATIKPITKAKTLLPKYKIVTSNDISRKALDRNFLSYSSSELAAAPTNKKYSYDIAILKPVTNKQLKLIGEKIISELTNKDNDLDEINLNFHSSKKATTAKMGIDLAIGTWGVNGKLGGVTSKIAKTNSRKNYTFSIKFMKNDIKSYMEKQKEETFFY